LSCKGGVEIIKDVTISSRNDSWHAEHNHNKPRKAATSHGHNHSDMGMRAMILHVIGDALGNAGVITAALIIWLTDSPLRFYADPAVSLFITLIILSSTLPLTKATATILLQATPDHIDVQDIKEDIQNIPGVVSCHHVHIWQLTETQIIASMHIQVAFSLQEEGGSERYMELAKAARKCLHAYGIHSATIQPEFCLDADHQHAPDTNNMNLDGVPPRFQIDNDSCLLECVDDCEEQGCCGSGSKTSTKSTPPQSSHGHNHDHDHDHDHDHAH
jgi:zinc transporter 1